jgi:hypothetical protein
MNNKKVVIIITVISVALLIASSCTIYIASMKKKAVQLAKDYLTQKYSREMKYLFTNSLILTEPALYHVVFSPKNEPYLHFEVLVQIDLSPPQEEINKYGYFVPDNYLLRIFEFHTDKFLRMRFEKEYNSGVAIYTVLNDQPLYSFKVPVEISEKTDAKDMERYIDYDIWFSDSGPFPWGAREEEADSIIKIIGDRKSVV